MSIKANERIINGVLLLILLAIPLQAWVSDNPFTITLATKIAILTLAGVGLNIALGIGGLVSFGHAAFFGIGGYAVGILASHAQNYEPLMTWPFELDSTQLMPVTWLVAIIASCLAALFVGALSLRTTGVYFIMITLAFGQMFYYFAISWPAYGGEDGLAIYVRGSFPGLNTLAPIQYFLLCYCVLLVGLFLASRLAASPFGLALNAARQQEKRVEAVGINPFRIRLVAFAISGAMTGLAGALFVDLNRFVSPAMLSWQTSGEIMVIIILGGVARLCGPLVGAAIFVVLEHFLGGLTEYWHIWFGLILLLVVLYARGGVMGLLLARTLPGGNGHE